MGCGQAKLNVCVSFGFIGRASKLLYGQLLLQLIQKLGGSGCTHALEVKFCRYHTAVKGWHFGRLQNCFVSNLRFHLLQCTGSGVAVGQLKCLE